MSRLKKTKETDHFRVINNASQLVARVCQSCHCLREDGRKAVGQVLQHHKSSQVPNEGANPNAYRVEACTWMGLKGPIQGCFKVSGLCGVAGCLHQLEP